MGDFIYCRFQDLSTRGASYKSSNKQIPADCPYVSENYLYLNRFIIIYRKHTPHYIIGNYSSKSVCSPIKASVVGKQGQLAFANDCPIATQCIILELFWLLDLLT